ncbi:amino acid transporter [Aspergillus campestris IBT 28561]|uniref:Amino acid transporter n=1 Tax=Aspergillus campestris (strain IBT 28561) TaxID=1392248 RepID=A0A2I1CTM3_ASPC2|nr:amino acid transporter [Aspergillus campestris IBT 28561]PKY00980.1 amino acid transporter [Aspergillus campestris IBT 28561]
MDAIKPVEITEEVKKMDYESPAEDQEKIRVAEPPKGDVFGDEDAEGVQYKVLSWQKCAIVMLAQMISLGVLSLPSAIATLGLIPGIIALIVLGLLAAYTAYVIFQFKIRYPHVVHMADAGEVIGGPIGREIVGAGQLLFCLFLMASHLLTFRVAMNAITEHGTCSIVFGIVGMIVAFVGNLPRTLNNVAKLSFISFTSIVSAVLLCMIGLAVTNSPAPVHAVKHTEFTTAWGAITDMVIAYAGHVAFFGFIAEMKEPKDFPKALCVLQIVEIALYVAVAVVIYCYAGDSVTSPALGSMGPILRRVAYGLALPSIVIAGVIFGHSACKQVYVRIWAGSDRIHKRDAAALGSWCALGVVFWLLAWVIAEAIPVFNSLLSLIAALFGSWFTYGLSGVFWLFMNRGQYFASPQKVLLTVLNVGLVGIATALCALGLWSSGRSIHEEGGRNSFSCS